MTYDILCAVEFGSVQPPEPIEAKGATTLLQVEARSSVCQGSNYDSTVENGELAACKLSHSFERRSPRQIGCQYIPNYS